MSEWKEIALQDVATVLGDGLHGTPKYDEKGEYYFINGSNLSNGKIIIDEKTKKTSAEEYEKYKKDLNNRTILVSINGTLGNVALYDNEKCILGKSACYFNVKENVNKLFIKYVVINRHFQEYISLFAHGTTIKNVSLKTMREYPFALPPREEQEAITAVLASLDDKINLLHRQNKTLEALARTLFRHWFIDGADDDWEEVTLDDVLTAVGGTTPSTKNSEYWDGEIHWTTPRDLSNNDSPYLLDTARKITESGLAKISSGLLSKGTLLLSSRAPVGYLAFSEVPIAINQGYIAILDNKGLSRTFIYLWLKENMDYVKSFANGSTFLEISKSAFRSLEITIPPACLRADFDQLVSPLFEKIKKNIYQVRTLEKLRDTLLPKLMSGDVRVLVPPTTHDLDLEKALNGVRIWPLSHFTRNKNRENIEISGLQVPIPSLVGLETLKLIEERHPNPRFEVGKVSNQKKEYVLARLGLDAGYRFGPGNNGPYSLDVVKAMELLKSAGLLNWEKQSDSSLEKVWAKSFYTEIRGSLLPKLEKYKPLIERTVELFKRIKSTRHAEEVGTVLFSFDQLEQEQSQRRPSREEIVNYVLNWKPRWGKRERKRERIHEAIDLLAEMAFIETD